MPVTTSLLSDDGREAFVMEHRAEYERLRNAYAKPKQTVVAIAKARERRTPIEWRAEDLAVPSFLGVRVLEDFPLETLREYIDWSPFFHTWGLRGLYPRILDDELQGEQARQIFADGKTLLDRIVREKLIEARGVYGLFGAAAVGDDVQLYCDEARGCELARLHFLRQQANREGTEPCRSLADFIAPEQLIQEKYRGIRPAPGYPACPDHTEKETIWRLLEVEKNTGMLLTESFAMWPGSSVSGLYFAHPKSRFFSLGKIDRDQVEDYAARKGMTLAEAERWLSQNLVYENA